MANSAEIIDRNFEAVLEDRGRSLQKMPLWLLATKLTRSSHAIKRPPLTGAQWGESLQKRRNQEREIWMRRTVLPDILSQIWLLFENSWPSIMNYGKIRDLDGTIFLLHSPKQKHQYFSPGHTSNFFICPFLK